MTLKNLFKLSTIVFLFTLVVSSLSYGQVVRYLNSTDGDDSYTGVNATNATFGTGPKRTLEAAVRDFPSGAIVYMTAGNYNYNQTGIGGGDDSNGYDLPTVPGNKSMTFIVQTYNGNKVVTLNGGTLTLQCGTGTITFKAESDQSISYNAATLQLNSGTLDVSGITFAATAALTTINRVDGALVGSPTYGSSAITLTYTNTSSITAGGEVPGTLSTLNLNGTAGTKVTFNKAITFGTTGGGIFGTTAQDAEFTQLVTLRGNAGAASPRIFNSVAGADWTFTGGVTILTGGNDGGNGAGTIRNSAAGSIVIAGELKIEQRDIAGVTVASHSIRVENDAAGTLKLTGGVNPVSFKAAAPTNYVANTTYQPVLDLENGATGTVDLGGGSGTTVSGILTTAAAAGKVNLKGAVTVNGALTNGAGHTIALGTNDLTLKAGITNGGTISSAAVGSGWLIFTAGTTDATGGTFGNIRSTAGGAVNLTTAATLAGSIENKGTSTMTIAGATTITGSVTTFAGAGLVNLTAAGNVNGSITSAAGGVTLGAPGTVGGSITINGGTVTTNVTTVYGTTTLNGGGLTLGGNTTLMGSYTQNAGTLNFGANTLACKSDFTRVTGTVTPGTGTLEFSAGGNQTFSGGTNLQVYNFQVNGVGTGVTFVNGSLEVLNNATIVSNTNVKLGSYNIRMLGTGGAGSTYANSGQVLVDPVDGGGGVIFESTLGAGTCGLISGNGINSNIEIRLGNEAGTIDVAAGQIVTWSGILTLTRGTLSVPAGTILNPSAAFTTPTIRRNLGDANSAGGADGKSLAVVGTFNATGVNYNLEYVGTGMTAVENVGPEFVTGAVSRVVNLKVLAQGNIVNLPGGADFPFSGNLTVANGSTLQIAGAPGTGDLISSNATAAHVINGKVTVTGTASFILTGGGTVTGGTKSTAPADDAQIDALTVNTSGSYDVNNLKLLGALVNTAGTTNLGMQLFGSPADEGNVNALTVTGGLVKLTKSADLAGPFAITGGTFDTDNNNLFVIAGGSVTATGGTIVATDASDKGFIVYEANGNLNSGTVAVPRVQINNGITTTLTGSSVISDIFNDYNTAGAGTLAMGANNLTLTAGTWNAKGTYTGTGTIIIKGATEAKLAGNITVPNLTVDNGTNTTKLLDNDGNAATVPTLSVDGLYNQKAGKIDLGVVDLALINAIGANVFTYDAGEIAATTNNSVTASDNANGELVFNSAANNTYTVNAEGLVIPNLRIAGTGNASLVAGGKAFTVSQRLVLANTGDLNFTTDENLIVGDGAWIKRMNNGGVFDKAPKFAGKVNLNYAATAAITVNSGKEVPASGTIQGLYINNAALVSAISSKALTVTDMLYLYAGDYDLESVANTVYPITVGESAVVNVRDGRLINSASVKVTPLAGGGKVNLIYSNTALRTTTGREFPATGFVGKLEVNTNLAGGGQGLILDANKTVGDFVLNTGADLNPAINTVRFDLNGKTLTVSNTSSAVLTRGVLSSESSVGGVYTYATLTSAGTVSSTANTSIQNVNVNGVGITLAGPFGQTDWDGVGGNALPANLTSMTATGAATVGDFNGTLNASANVTVTANLGAASTLVFRGSANADLTVPAAGATITNMTINKDGIANTVTLKGGNLRTNGNITFTRGQFVTGNFSLYINQPSFAAGGQGFTGASANSHVVGNVVKVSQNAGALTAAGTSNSRFEFPVGTMTLYRPVAITFNPAFGVPTNPNNYEFKVATLDGSVGGFAELPIVDGVAKGIDIARYPAFYWTIASSPSSVGPSTAFDLELTAGAAFSDYDTPDNVRIIRRHGAAADITNPWLLQGTNDSYDNSVNSSILTVIQRGATAGLRSGGAVFTYGLKSNIKVVGKIDKQYLVIKDGAKNIDLSNLFASVDGSALSVNYSAKSSDETVASVSLNSVKKLLSITPLKTGNAVVTVTVRDTKTGDSASYDIMVYVSTVGVEAEEIPTEFSLSQNYPNPFNPTTTIKFGLPKEGNVTLRVFNILGEEVATLVNKVMSAGYHTVNFDASHLASGMYIYRIEADNFVQVKKMLLMK